MVFPKLRNTSPHNSCNPFTTISTTCSPMSLPVIFVGIIVLTIVAPSHAQPLLPGVNSRNFEYKRYCSNSLSDVMRLICGGRTNTLNVPYQDISGSVYSSNLKRLSDDDGNLLRTGQIHECCRRPCGYSELKMYCGPV